MTDTTNGWRVQPGVPFNPEKDGWHWLENKYTGDRRANLWLTDLHWGLRSPIHEVGKACTYLGPCLTPDEVQNLRDDLASAERERAHQHGRADRNAAQYAREQGKREALQARVAELEGALDAASSVLHKAGKQFSEYAKQHAAYRTAVSDLKADFNKQWAERCFSAYWRAVEGGKDE